MALFAAVVLIIIATGAGYAIATLISSTEPQSLHIKHDDYTEITPNNFFPTDTATMRPGDSISINPMFTNSGSVPMYMFMYVEMPACAIDESGSTLEGMFELEDSTWELVESGLNDNGDMWYEVYRYGELNPDQSD